MANQKTTRELARSDKENEKREQLEREYSFNRQINFLVMRKLWQIIRGRAPRGATETIYTDFDMSRARYTRAVDGDRIRFSKKELEHLVLKTGLRSDIFEGRTHFQFRDISDKDWKKLFELRGNKDAGYKGQEDYVFSLIQEEKINPVENPDFYRFVVYLKQGVSATDINVEQKLQKLIVDMNAIKFHQLERCGADILKEYLNILRQQMDATGTLVHYMELKQK